MKKRYWLLALITAALMTACPGQPDAQGSSWENANWGTAVWR
jgi:hypothetical protein